MIEAARVLGPPLLAALTALALDRAMAARGLMPPCMRLEPTPDQPAPLAPAVRRATGTMVVAVALWLSVFAPLGVIGLEIEQDLDQVPPLALFSVHATLLGTAAIWYVLGFLCVGRADPRGWLDRLAVQFGLRARRPWREIGLGVVVGVSAWAIVLAAMMLVGLAIWALGGEELLPSEPPPLIPWLVTLPVALRFLLSVSAGVAEEVFFRGFLQPRFGITLSTVCFVLAHLSYDQPFMLVGITLLSLVFALLVKWRQNIWPAIAAHATFDAVQLLVVIPTVLEHVPAGAEVVGG